MNKAEKLDEWMVMHELILTLINEVDYELDYDKHINIDIWWARRKLSEIRAILNSFTFKE